MSVKDRGARRSKQSAQDELTELLTQPTRHIKIVATVKRDPDDPSKLAEVIASNHAAIARATMVPERMLAPEPRQYAPRMPQLRQGSGRKPRTFKPANGVSWEAQITDGKQKPIRIRGSKLQPGDIMRNGKVVVQAVEVNIVATPGIMHLLKCSELTMVQFRGEDRPVVFTDTVHFYVVRPSQVMQ